LTGVFVRGKDLSAGRIRGKVNMDSEIKNGKVIIGEPGLECPAIIISIISWIVILFLWLSVWLSNTYK